MNHAGHNVPALARIGPAEVFNIVVPFETDSVHVVLVEIEAATTRSVMDRSARLAAFVTCDMNNGNEESREIGAEREGAKD